MKKVFLRLVGLVVLTILGCSGVATATPTARFSYVIRESRVESPVQFEVNLSDSGIRYNYRRDDRHHSLLYRPEPEPVLYTLNHENVRAFKVSDEGINHYVKLIQDQRNRMRNQLKSLPESRRNKIEQRVDLSRLDPDHRPEEPRFESKGETTWRGRRAQVGEFQTAEGTMGEAVLNDRPLVDISEKEKTVLKRFSEFLYRWVGISSQVSSSELNTTRNLITRHYLRLLRYKNDRVEMELLDAERTNRSAGFYQVPPSFRVESLKNLTPRSRSTNRP
jgi:hypothetical protein